MSAEMREHGPFGWFHLWVILCFRKCLGNVENIRKGIFGRRCRNQKICSREVPRIYDGSWKICFTQVREIQRIIREVKLEGKHLPDQFSLASTIYKLLPSWKEYGISLKHKCKDMRMHDLLIHLPFKNNTKIAIRKLSIRNISLMQTWQRHNQNESLRVSMVQGLKIIRIGAVKNSISSLIKPLIIIKEKRSYALYVGRKGIMPKNVIIERDKTRNPRLM